MFIFSSGDPCYGPGVTGGTEAARWPQVAGSPEATEAKGAPEGKCQNKLGQSVCIVMAPARIPIALKGATFLILHHTMYNFPLTSSIHF